MRGVVSHCGTTGGAGIEAECLRSSGDDHLRKRDVVPCAMRTLIVAGVVGLGLAGAIAAQGPAILDPPVPFVQAPVVVRVAVKPAPRILDFSLTPDERPTPAPPPSGTVDKSPSDFLLELAILAGSGDPEDVLEFGPMRIKRHLVHTILRASQAAEVDPVLLMAIADKESSFATAVRARTSSATGLYQFIDDTWLHVVRDFGARHGLAKEAAAIVWKDDRLTVADEAERTRILELRREPYPSALLAAEMLKRDRARIAAQIGRDLTDGETYIAHFLGPADAERFMGKVAASPGIAAAKLLPKPARANRSIFFAGRGRRAKSLSVAEVHRKFETMMATRFDRYRNVQEVATTPLPYVEAALR